MSEQWEILSGPSRANAGGLCEWKAKCGARVLTISVPSEATPKSADFDHAWAHALSLWRHKR